MVQWLRICLPVLGNGFDLWSRRILHAAGQLIAYGEQCGFTVSKEDDLASGPGTGLDHSTAFVYQSFVKVRKGTEKASDIDIRGGRRAPPSLVLARELYTFLISHSVQFSLVRPLSRVRLFATP